MIQISSISGVVIGGAATLYFSEDVGSPMCVRPSRSEQVQWEPNLRTNHGGRRAERASLKVGLFFFLNKDLNLFT